MVDVSSQIDAVRRAVRTAELDDEPVHVQTISQEYPTGIEDLWDAVTTADRIARWFLPVTGDLRRGGRYQLEGNAGGEVLECVPPAEGQAHYRVTWEYGGAVSWVTVRLTAQDPERTRFELEHTARVADVPAAMWDTFGPGATGVGWDQGLLGLALHVHALDGAIAPGDAEAWMTSDEGRAFTRSAADAWARAHVAAGADPDTARRNADAVFAFYTGLTPDA